MHGQSRSSMTELHGFHNEKDNEQSIEEIDNKTPISPGAQIGIEDNEGEDDIEDMFVKKDETTETTNGDDPQTTGTDDV